MVTLALTWWTARRELGGRAAVVSLLVLGLSPLFVFHASTFFSHAASTMWLALAFAATSSWTRGKRDGWLLLLGAALGGAFITRPADAVLFGVALLVLRSVRLVLLSVAGASPFLAAHLWYQARQFGSPFSDGYHAYEPTFRAIYGDSTAVHPISLFTLLNPEAQFHHLDVFRAFVVDWTVAGAVLVALIGAYAIDAGHPARRMRDIALSIAVVLLVALIPMVSDPDDGARPRYLSTMLLSVAFLAGPGWVVVRHFLVSRIGLRLARAVAVLAVVFAPVQFASFLIVRLPQLWQREGLYTAVAREHLTDAVVVVRGTYPTRYARNGAFFEGPVLYVSAPATTSLDAVHEAFAGRDLYEATEGRGWTLVKRFAGQGRVTN
jgi:4-amino-4-deoxy-L-arabinose transferase-like glycosyltransferase